MAPVFNEAEFGHTMLPRAGVVDSFVVVDEKSGKVTDLCSFYHLPSTVMKHPKHNKLNAGYSFYNVATTVPLKQLMGDLLIQAKVTSFTLCFLVPISFPLTHTLPAL